MMIQASTQPRLSDGTLVEHKVSGYRGRIDGITEIKSCFTRAGANAMPNSIKDAFQYRIAVTGEPMRHIAPAEDLNVVVEEAKVNISCFKCHTVFRTNPGVANRRNGRCECGGWICPECLACDSSSAAADTNRAGCTKQTQRMKRRHAGGKTAAARVKPPLA
jgi:hypothetical protein